MSLSHIRSRIEALERKFADAITVVRARRVAEEMCHQWARNVAERQPLPEEFEFCRKLPDAGIASGDWFALRRYVARRLENNDFPNPWDMLKVFLPGAKRRVIINAAFRSDARPDESDGYRPGEPSTIAFPILD